MSGYYIHCSGGRSFGRFSALDECSDLLHFVSTRQGGISEKPFDSLNLGLRTADFSENVSKNYELLRKEVGLNDEPILSPVQTHSTNVISIDNANLDKVLKSPQTFLANTDALITNLPGKCLMVMSADCVPVLFYDKKLKVIGACHAGWRGVVAGICTKTVEKMFSVSGTSLHEIMVGIGPSIGPEHFEVGEDVVQEFREVFSVKQFESIYEKRDHKQFINLWTAIFCQLTHLGVNPPNISIANQCTIKRNDLYYSHRKENGITGRFGAGIMLR